MFKRKPPKIHWSQVNTKALKFYNFFHWPEYDTPNEETQIMRCVGEFYCGAFDDKDRDYFKQFFYELKKKVEAEENPLRINYQPQFKNYQAVKDYNFGLPEYQEQYADKIKWILEEFMEWTAIFRDHPLETLPRYKKTYMEFYNAPIYKVPMQIVADTVEALDKMENQPHNINAHGYDDVYELFISEENDKFFLREKINGKQTDYHNEFKGDKRNFHIMKKLFTSQRRFIPYKELDPNCIKRDFVNITKDKERLNRHFAFGAKSVQFISFVKKTSH